MKGAFLSTLIQAAVQMTHLCGLSLLSPSLLSLSSLSLSIYLFLSLSLSSVILPFRLCCFALLVKLPFMHLSLSFSPSILSIKHPGVPFKPLFSPSLIPFLSYPLFTCPFHPSVSLSSLFPSMHNLCNLSQDWMWLPLGGTWALGAG